MVIGFLLADAGRAVGAHQEDVASALGTHSDRVRPYRCCRSGESAALSPDRIANRPGRERSTRAANTVLVEEHHPLRPGPSAAAASPRFTTPNRSSGSSSFPAASSGRPYGAAGGRAQRPDFRWQSCGKPTGAPTSSDVTDDLEALDSSGILGRHHPLPRHAGVRPLRAPSAPARPVVGSTMASARHPTRGEPASTRRRSPPASVRIRESIAAGDVYQVNLTQAPTRAPSIDPPNQRIEALGAALALGNPAPVQRGRCRSRTTAWRSRPLRRNASSPVEGDHRAVISHQGHRRDCGRFSLAKDRPLRMS